MEGPSARDVSAKIESRLEAFRETYGVRSIQLYGSVAREEADAASDVDLIVEFTEVPSLFDIAELQAELEEILGRSVDITTPGGLHPRVLANARADAVEIGSGA